MFFPEMFFKIKYNFSFCLAVNIQRQRCNLKPIIVLASFSVAKAWKINHKSYILLKYCLSTGKPRKTIEKLTRHLFV